MIGSETDFIIIMYRNFDMADTIQMFLDNKTV